ncbi:MAG: porin, partial [Gammaproteobacteria bacterium]
MLQLPKTRYSGLALATLLSGLSTTASASELFASDSPWMLGDWGGTRTELLEQGYDF